MWECCWVCSLLATSFRLFFNVLLAINPTFSTKSLVSPEVRPAGNTTLSPFHEGGLWNIDYCCGLHKEAWLLCLHRQAGRKTMAEIWNEATQCSANTVSFSEMGTNCERPMACTGDKQGTLCWETFSHIFLWNNYRTVNFGQKKKQGCFYFPISQQHVSHSVGLWLPMFKWNY